MNKNNIIRKKRNVFLCEEKKESIPREEKDRNGVANVTE